MTTKTWLHILTVIITHTCEELDTYRDKIYSLRNNFQLSDWFRVTQVQSYIPVVLGYHYSSPYYSLLLFIHSVTIHVQPNLYTGSTKKSKNKPHKIPAKLMRKCSNVVLDTFVFVVFVLKIFFWSKIGKIVKYFREVSLLFSF